MPQNPCGTRYGLGGLFSGSPAQSRTNHQAGELPSLVDVLSISCPHGLKHEDGEDRDRKEQDAHQHPELRFPFFLFGFSLKVAPCVTDDDAGRSLVLFGFSLKVVP